MHSKILFKQLFSILLLAVIPVVLIFIGINLRLANQNYSMFNIDPEFSLLFSGIALGHGSINLFIDQPGTPVIVFAAIIMRIIHLFRPSSSFTQDVLQNPDFYLNALNISMIVFITLIIFFAGWCIYRKTGNLPAAIFIQFSPFVVEHVISIIERFMPEPWFIAHVIVLCSITVLDLYGYFNNTKLKYQSWLVYGVIIGFGISLKLTFLPFFLAPLFLLTGIRKKSYYLGTTALSFLIFTFPIFKRSREFFRWTKALAINSGRYGSGKASVIDPDQFFIQLKAIIQSEKYLVYITILALLVLIISLLPWVRRRIGNKRYIAALAGFTATLIVGILIISKQYAGHYLVPYSLLTVFICYLSINVLIEIVQFRKWWLEAIIYSLVALMMLSNPKSIKQHKKYLEIRRQNLSYKKEIVTEIEKLPQSDVLILSADNWHFKKEAGLIFGMLMTPRGVKKYGEQLNTLYPNTCLFKESEGKFFNWLDKPFTASELLVAFSKITVMVKHNNEAVFKEIEDVFEETEKADVEIIYSDPKTNLTIYEIRRVDSGLSAEYYLPPGSI